jgi:hypothetical protein
MRPADNLILGGAALLLEDFLRDFAKEIEIRQVK